VVGRVEDEGRRGALEALECFHGWCLLWCDLRSGPAGPAWSGGYGWLRAD
jgi:hypothetical protein